MSMDIRGKYKPYLAYKDSGVEWLGKVPEGWISCRFSRVISAIKDGTHGTFQRINDGKVLLSAKNINDGSIYISGDDSFISNQDHLSIVANGFPRKYDLLLTIVGTIGRACIYMFDEPLSFQRSVCFIRLSPSCCPKYFYFFTQSKFFQEHLQSKSKASAQSGIYMGDVAASSIAFPASLLEQQTIATFLEEETVKIDTLITEQERLIELLQEKRTALISHAVTKGLNPDAPMKDSGVKWLGEVPEHWMMKRLKNISPFITVGIVVNPSEYIAEEGLPFIYGGDISGGKINIQNCRKITGVDSQKNAKTRLEAGDLLTVRVGAPGITAVVTEECEGGNCASVMLTKKGDFESNWLCYAMNSRMVRYQVKLVQYGAAQEQFNISHAINFWIAIPPLEEQQAITTFLDHETAKIDTLITKSRQAIDFLKERRTALISTAVTGKIDVRDTIN